MGVYDPKKQKFFNAPTIVGIISFMILSYFGAWYLPHWWKVWRMTGVMRGVAFDGYHQTDSEPLYKKLVAEARRLELTGAVKEDFKFERIPYSPEELSDKDDHDKALLVGRGKFVVITMDYYVAAKWPFRDASTELHFFRRVEQDMATITW
ncbi:MAG: hypothetical protein HY791_01600 [Deltaproteobacteria bacterium]|nr:hypothetical protein [Deltaproteobacteria bacterium]